MREIRVGTVDHYFSHLGVITLNLERELKVGDIIHVKGHTTDFIHKVESLEVDHKSVNAAKSGDGIGIKVAAHGRIHDTVYKIVEE